VREDTVMKVRSRSEAQVRTQHEDTA